MLDGGFDLLGCLAIGVIAGAVDRGAMIPPATRVAIMVGFLGGFTTFSSFGLETFSLVRSAQSLAASLNVGLEVALGLLAVWIGNVLARLV